MGDLVQLTFGPRRGLRRGTRATAWFELGCELERTDPAAAITAYERAIAGRADLADAHNNLGRIHHERGHAQADRAVLAAAESCYRLALCIDPAVALYWFNLGVVVEDQSRHAEAIAAYTRALELDPQLGNAHFNLARILELEGRRQGDELAIRTAIRHLAKYRALVRGGDLSSGAPGRG